MSRTRSAPTLHSTNRPSKAAGTSSWRKSDKRAPIANVIGARLRWWRTHAADAFSKIDAESIRAALRACPNGGDSRWARAIAGDAAAAIGIAIRVVWRRESNGISEDAALSAVLACALDRDAAAIFLLSAALDRRAKRHRECERLADSWLLASVKGPSLVPSD